MKSIRLAFVALLAAITSFCSAGAPAYADPAPQPKVILKIYPKLLPPQPGEVIIRDPRAPPPPSPVVSPDPIERAKDPRTWA